MSITSVRGRRFGSVLYGLMRGLAWVCISLISHCRVEGVEHIPPSGPLLVVSNHLSWCDPLILGLVLRRRVWFYTKAEIFKWPVAGWLCRATGQIAVRRGGGDRISLQQAIAYLHEGKALVIFPEGTVERQEHMTAAHTGVAMLALRSGVPVLPVALSGARRVLRKGGGLRPYVVVRIGIPYTPVLSEGAVRKAGLQVLTKEIMGKIAEMLPPESRGVYG